MRSRAELGSRRRAPNGPAGCWLLVALACAASGCHRGEPTPPADGGPPPVEPVIPTPSAAASGAEAMPAWAAALPQGKPTVRKGQRVWATVPVRGSELATTAIYQVEGVHDGELSLTDKMGQRIDRVPPAVVHRAAKTGKLTEGEVVLCYAFTLPAVLARVAKLEAGREIRVRYDWAGKTKQDTIYHAERPRKGVQPLAFVGFPKAGATSRGLVVALDAKRVWVATSSGEVEIHPREAVKPLPVLEHELAVGQAVRAYAWQTGYQPGQVAAILEPGLRYRVKLDSGLPDRAYFFSALIASR